MKLRVRTMGRQNEDAAGAEERRYSDLALYRRLLVFARPFWPHIGVIFFLNLLGTPLALLAPLPLKIAVDSVLGSHPLPGFVRNLLPPAMHGNEAVLLAIAGLMVGIALLSQAQKLSAWLLSTYVGERLVLSFRAELFRRAQRLSLLYHDSRGTSDSTYRIQYDAAALQWIAVDGLIPFVTSIISLAVTVAVVARLEPSLAAAALVIAPVLFGVTAVFRRRLRTQWREVKKLETSALKVVQEVLSALRVVKAFGQEDREQDRFVRHSSDGTTARLRVVLSESLFSLLIGLTTAGGTAAILYLGVRHVQAGTLTLGELLLVMAYLGQLYDPLQTISKKIASQQSTLASAERAFTLLDEELDIQDGGSRPLGRAFGEVAFQDVTFGYSREYPVLRGVSFRVAPGTRVGIAGSTGAGKTTLVNLWCRFYDPLSGSILLDGHDIRTLRLADLRDQFAIVLQEPVLFATSIRENIAYARPGATHEEIVRAAEAANVHQFIASLPEGYDTLVGERGLRLSGGERQRISLARAFLKDAPVLILDEPTSSVDVRTEAAIMESMQRLMQDRTTFMIAHRLSTLESCDLVLHIEGGRLADAAPEPLTAAGGTP
jgi:ATP-binding cassette, subfamily B, bacterial